MNSPVLVATLGVLVISACSAGNGRPTTADAPAAAPQASASEAPRPGGAAPFTATPMGKFNEPWAMTFLPDGRLLVTEKRGQLRLVDPTGSGEGATISGVPEVDYGGQGGLGDVVLHPQFQSNSMVYFSYAEAGEGDTRGAAVARAKLDLNADGGGGLSEVEVIWRQVPKVTGRGHYGHRIAFSPTGEMFISSGERQKFDPAQDMASNLGKIVRLNDDGTVPTDNPFADQGGVAAQVWTLGHRNAQGIAFDSQGRLWAHEMGPKGGDELNLIERGSNYGYPIVSNGDHYDGRNIHDHHTRPEFNAPEVSWTPVISPAGLVFYSGASFPQWQGQALIGGLSGQALVRVAFDGNSARQAARHDMGKRIREVEQGPDGDVWVLEDGLGGRLLRLSPGG
ncbi:MAG: PQQ-dependent sugar dehydrogenase [Lysobacter sp.]|nr:PQQ-dependent sugar dehydrogenase [Lysobacter sp.]